MARSHSQARAANPGSRPTPSGRPSLIPEDPLPGWKAALQALVLLGLPLALLLIAKVILRTFFPQLGY
jgi:hypothetical protein